MDDDHADMPMGKSTLRWVEGQGYVNCPHLFRVTFEGRDGLAETYEVQSFYGETKARAVATEAHKAGFGWLVERTRVEYLGPTAPGGASTALDDRAEW